MLSQTSNVIKIPQPSQKRINFMGVSFFNKMIFMKQNEPVQIQRVSMMMTFYFQTTFQMIQIEN